MIAVLTGDIVKSTRMKADVFDTVMKTVIKAANEASRFDASSAPPARAEVFRGDGWQAVLGSPSVALRAAFYVRASAIVAGGDTRVSIGIGGFDHIDKKNVARSSGEAFLASGRGLDEMKPRQRLVLFDDGFDASAHRWARTAIGLGDVIASGWTRRQAEIVLYQLRQFGGVTGVEIAKHAGVATQTISKHLKAARWDSIELLLNAFAEEYDARAPSTSKQ